MYLLRPQAPIQRSQSIHIAGVDLEFVPAFLGDGSLVMASVVPEGEEGKSVLAKARRMRTAYTVVGDAYGIEWQQGPPRGARGVDGHSPGRGVAKIDREPPMIRAAKHNGWKAEDMEGAGQDGEWGPDGGLGRATGLTMADMALSSPPPKWDSLRKTHWPWQCQGWKPPGESWIHPALDPKVPSDVDEAAEAAEVDVVDPASDAPTEPPPTVEPVDKVEPEPPAGDHAQILAEFDPQERQAAVLILAELIKDSGGKRPSYNKLNYRLSRAGLPTVGKDELAALNHLYDQST